MSHSTHARAVLLVLLGFALLAAVGAPVAQAATGCFNELPGRPTVVLDPGHGGKDPGTSNTGTFNGVSKLLLEKDLNLDIALRVKDILVGSYGYRVCLTRTTDLAANSEMTNTQRAEYANTAGGKVFVLVHLNGSTNHAVDYTQTFWGKRNKDLSFATAMYNALSGSLGIPGNGVGQFASGALLKSNMPAALTESVFLTNDNEANQLADARTAAENPNSRRQQIAGALARGIFSWVSTH
jgi:N-acetylmuramoyl-L-alanine amidase